MKKLILPLLIASQAALADPATLTWTSPPNNCDATPLTNLSGYKIYWGTVGRVAAGLPALSTGTCSDPSQVVPTDPKVAIAYEKIPVVVANPAQLSAVISLDKPSTRYFFGITAYTNTPASESNLSNEVSKITNGIAIGPGSVLTGSQIAGPVTAVLSTVGTADWIHLGLTTATSLNRKAGVTSQIVGTVNLSAAPTRVTTGGNILSWTGGTPTATSAAYPGIARYTGLNAGYTFTVPSTNTTKTLTVYTGGLSSTGTVTVSLADNSVPAYVVPIVYGATASSNVFTIKFSSVANTTLTFKHQVTTGTGSVAFQGAALDVAPSFILPVCPTCLSSFTGLILSGVTGEIFTIQWAPLSMPTRIEMFEYPPKVGAVPSFTGNFAAGVGSYNWVPTRAGVYYSRICGTSCVDSYNNGFLFYVKLAPPGGGGVG